MLGDPDQNIYEWRFAIYKNILMFEENLKTTYNFKIKKQSLTLNHRLHSNLVDLALKYIKSNDCGYH